MSTWTRFFFFFFNDTATTEIYTLSLHDALSDLSTEVVKIRAYPTANGITQLTRLPSGTVTTDSTATDLGTTLVQVDVATSWTMTLGRRSRSEQVTSIISNGTKK